MNGKYILEGHKAVPCNDMVKWAQWFEAASKDDTRRVALTKKGKIRVSTVFLGLDHSFGEGKPMLFETMIFGGPHDEDMDRYTTWEEAEAGHKRMCIKAFRKTR